MVRVVSLGSRATDGFVRFGWSYSNRLLYWFAETNAQSGFAIGSSLARLAFVFERPTTEQRSAAVSDAETAVNIASVLCDALDLAPMGIAVVAPDSRVLAANHTMRCWLEPAGVFLEFGVLLPLRCGEVPDAFSAGLRGESSTMETNQLEFGAKLDGSWRLHAMPLRAGSRIVGVTFMLEDLREQALAMRAFEASEYRFRALVNNAGIGIAAHRAGIVLYMNPVGAGILGFAEADALVGRPLREWVHPEDRETVQRRIAEADQFGRTAPSRERYVAQDGRVVTLESTFSCAPVEQYPAGLVFFWPIEISRLDGGHAGRQSDVAGFDPGDLRSDLAAVEACWAALRESLPKQNSGLFRRGHTALGKLRLRLESDGAMAPEQSTDEAEDGGEDLSLMRHVLICDDEQRLASLMGGLLEQCGYRATPVTTGAAAVAIVARGGVDAVLLDVHLPGEDTAGILAQLAELAPNLPVLLSSGYPSEDLHGSIVNAPNVADYLDKPYTVDKLVDVLERLVGAARPNSAGPSPSNH